jgi:hypothetical protein
MRVTSTADERGSLALALLAAIVASGIAVALVNTVIQSERTARFDRSFTNAVQVADAGVQDAFYRIEHGLLSLDIGDQVLSDPAWIEGWDVRYEVERLTSRSYEVRSTGYLDGITRTVVARIDEEALFFPGAFGDRLVALNGTSTLVDSYESRSTNCVGNADPARCWGANPSTNLFGTGNGALGTNEIFDFSGNTTVNRAILYDWAANPGQNPTEDNPGGSRCVGPNVNSPCKPEVLRFVDDRLEYGSQEQMQFIVDKLDDDRCSEPGRELGSATFGGKIGNTTYPTTLEPYSTDFEDSPFSPADPGWENYYCADRLSFVGQTTFPGATPETPVVIFVRDSVAVSNQTTVNCLNCPSSGSGKYWRGPNFDRRPKAQSLQIYVATDNEQGGADVSVAAGSVWAGVIYAPRARCGAPGGAGADIYGSIVCRYVDNVGNWKFHFDEALADLGRGVYTVATWREEPSIVIPLT